MSRPTTTLVAALAVALGGAVAVSPGEDPAETVRRREGAFAQTMADRDPAAFATFVSREAVFLGSEVLKGREAVVEGWRRFFDGASAPFSWEPERVVVIESGTLAISTGPVRDPSGTRIGTFNSTWRLEEDGQWRVVLDNGCPPCRCPTTPAPEPEG